MASWPLNLPSPLADGYSFAPSAQVVRSDMEVGAPRARRRTFARNDRVRANWFLTDAQLEQFRAWFDDSDNGAAAGAAYFDVRLAVATGGLKIVQARFVSPYQAVHAGAKNWRVSAELELR